MALKLTVDSLDSVPEALRGEYTEKDGKFVLGVDGLEDTTGLKTALQKERAERANFEKQAKAYAGLGLSADEIKALIDAKAKDDEDKAVKGGEWDKLRAQMNEKHATEIKGFTDKLSAKDKALERFLIDGEATKAIAGAKGVPELLLPHVRQHVRMVEENNDYFVRVVDAKGDPRVNGKGEPLTISDLVAEMAASEVFGRAFEGSGQSGSGKQPGNGGGGTSKTMTQSAFNALSPKDRAAKMAEGVTLI